MARPTARSVLEGLGFLWLLLLTFPLEPTKADPLTDNAMQVTSLRSVPGLYFMAIGKNSREIESMMLAHTPDTLGTSDNKLAPMDFALWDPLHHKLMLPGINLGDYNNPANLKMGRVLTDANNKPDYSARYVPWTIVGQSCGLGWGPKGFTACQTAIQYIAVNEKTGAMCFSTATGRDGHTPPSPPDWPNGAPFTAETLVCHVILHPDGHLEIGVNTDPSATPLFSLIVKGDAKFKDVTVTGDIHAETIYAKNFVQIR